VAALGVGMDFVGERDSLVHPEDEEDGPQEEP
jgi:hypothetical protein